MFSVIILAAGLSTRMNGIKKQFFKINGKMVLEFSVKTFLKAGAFEIIIATNLEYVNFVKKIFQKNSKIKIVAGGTTRQQSAKIAFSRCNQTDNNIVLIHDAARPFVQLNQIKNLVKIAKKTKAATLALVATDTVKLINKFKIKSTLNRNQIALIQTPQAFSKKLYKQALESTNKQNFTDDCQLIENLNHPIYIVRGSKINFKITTKFDLILAEIIAKKFNL